MVKQWIQKWVSGWRATPGVAPSVSPQPVPTWQVPAYRRRQLSGDRCGR